MASNPPQKDRPLYLDLPPYYYAVEVGKQITKWFTETGDARGALDAVDRAIEKAELMLPIGLTRYTNAGGNDPDQFVLSHWHGLRVLRYLRSRHFFRAVLNWEPPPHPKKMPMMFVRFDQIIWN